MMGKRAQGRCNHAKVPKGRARAAFVRGGELAPGTPFWSLSADEILRSLGTGSQGLAAPEAAARLATLGPNRLTETRRNSNFRLLLRQFASPLVLMLAFAAVLSLAMHEADHGNLERDAMLTPLLVNGPGVAQSATLPGARLVDIYPTAALLLGADPEDPALSGLDGKSLPGVQPPKR